MMEFSIEPDRRAWPIQGHRYFAGLHLPRRLRRRHVEAVERAVDEAVERVMAETARELFGG